MREQILEIIRKTNPKTVSRVIKNNAELCEWVLNNSSENTNFSNRIYDSVNPNQTVCIHGYNKKFKSLVEGYGFCGKPKTCECAREQISQKVSDTKSKFSDEDREQINKKRASTNLKKYGVANAGQTEAAKASHAQFYIDYNQKNPKPPKRTLLEQSYDRIKNKLSNNHDIQLLTDVSRYIGVSSQVYYDFECMKCSHRFRSYLDNGHIPVCNVCNPQTPSYVSNAEIDLKNYIQSLIPNENIATSDKSIINPWELDIVIPSRRLAIEYCGLYWHSSVNGKSIDYHYRKMNLANTQGYRLITVFEDEWLLKRKIVESRLQNILGVSQKTYARKTQICQVSGSQARNFLENTHIQGHAASSINLALMYDNRIYALMTFGKSRYNKNYEYEIIRYSSVGTVVGGASRLFRHFLKMYQPHSVISYCDLRWGTGEMYEKIGMTHLKNTGPGYSYTDFVTRSHRSNFTKQRLMENVNARGDTEEELARSIKWYRIGDCGNSVYVWNSD